MKNWREASEPLMLAGAEKAALATTGGAEVNSIKVCFYSGLKENGVKIFCQNLNYRHICKLNKQKFGPDHTLYISLI